MAQESDDLHAGDVDRVETKVQPETLSGWGHGDTGDDGNAIPSIAVREQRGLSDRRPGLAEVRDEEEAAFVDGASRIYTLRRVVLPLAAPGLIGCGRSDGRSVFRY